MTCAMAMHYVEYHPTGTLPQQATCTETYLAVLVFMFSISTTYWILSLYQDLNLITTSFVHVIPMDETVLIHSQNEQDVMNTLVLLNHVLTNGVVVWRAWVLCRDEYSKSLILPLVFLCLTLSSLLATIGLRVTIIVVPDIQHTIMTLH
ncbi:uncharacterized protein EV420DRAFT_1508721 [Desarmillaria tabescens]|uniref:Uncharacterized protein n=1 Tax=Armillaria tabescens TaxID=1929756 RepID=A0AA39NI68_ARMTA|nr:uncharacterized protein EV420DRAFT_1508721 [Desarmillaria tabescens]KAK0465908.1 hypothetical protein EV420DRAFT_1508721 [Desarmillaria tabescens]